MNYQKTTQVPNELFDSHLTSLTNSELKILLYIIRQTYGWKLKNGKRKKRDRITYKQFNQKTKVSIRSIPSAIQSLITKHLIKVTDSKGNLLHVPEQRKGKVGIYYTPCLQRCAESNQKVCKKIHQPMHNRVYNKTNIAKLTIQKISNQQGRVSDWERIQDIIAQKDFRKTKV